MAPIFSLDSKNRILILTAGFGDGHNAAARNIRDALHLEAAQRGLEATEAEALDLLDSAHPVISGGLRSLYRAAIAYTPGAWEKLYHFSDQIDPKGDPLGLFTKSTIALKEILERYQPKAVISTYMVYPQLLERITGRHGKLPCPAFTVVTDSGTINGVWRKGRTDRFFVADETSKEALSLQGVPEDRIDPLGFPIGLAYEAASNGHTGDPKPPHVLYFPMTSKKMVRDTLHAMTALNSGLKLTVVLGRNEKRLRSTVERAVRRREGVEVIGWTNRIPDLLATHHAVVGKAGGASVQEAMVAAKPLILNYVVPGQEEGNAKLAVAAGFGIRAEKPDEVARALENLFADDAALWRRMTENARTAARPHAARNIARSVLDTIPS